MAENTSNDNKGQWSDFETVGKREFPISIEGAIIGSATDPRHIALYVIFPDYKYGVGTQGAMSVTYADPETGKRIRYKFMGKVVDEGRAADGHLYVYNAYMLLSTTYVD